MVTFVPTFTELEMVWLLLPEMLLVRVLLEISETCWAAVTFSPERFFMSETVFFSTEEDPLLVDYFGNSDVGTAQVLQSVF